MDVRGRELKNMWSCATAMTEWLKSRALLLWPRFVGSDPASVAWVCRFRYWAQTYSNHQPYCGGVPYTK